MIPDKKKRRLALSCGKKTICVIERITGKNFYCLGCLRSFRTENSFKSHEKVCKNKDFCGIVMPFGKDNILKFNQYINSDKIPYFIFTGFESLIKKISIYKQSRKVFKSKIRRAYSLWKFNVNNLGI